MKKRHKPRASTAQSRKSVTIAEQDEVIENSELVHPQTLSKESLVSSVKSEDAVVASKNSLNKKLSNQSAPYKATKSDVQADMKTEVGSNHEGEWDYGVGEDSGNEADLDTEGVSFIQDPSLILETSAPTKEEIQRQYAKGMAERLCQAALLAGAKDNITVMIVLFPGCGL